MIVYCFTNQVNGKRYVGITDRTLDYRWCKHVIAANNGSEYHFHRAIRKHGDAQFEGHVLEECMTIGELKDAERRWIWLLASNCPSRGYNMTLGGDGIFGHVMSEESKQKMREAHIGKRHTEEQKQKISNAMKRRYEDPAERKRTSDALMGHAVSEETRKKFSLAHTGKIVSAETRQKLSVAARKRWLNKKKNEVTI